MSDGTPVPVSHDGTAAFRGHGNTTLLIRNHEVRSDPGTVEGSVQAPEDKKHDVLGVGGNVSVVFDTRRGRVCTTSARRRGAPSPPPAVATPPCARCGTTTPAGTD